MESSESDRFILDVESIKDDIGTMEKLQKRLQDANEQSRTMNGATNIKQLRAIMDSDVDHLFILAKAIMKQLEGLERCNVVVANGSPNERARVAIVVGMGKKLREIMEGFEGLRVKIGEVYKESVEFKYFSVTGEKQHLEIIENFVTTGELGPFLLAAGDEKGSVGIVDVVQEIQERRDGAKDMEKCVIDLHEILLRMIGLVEAQAEKVSGNEGRLPGANTLARPAVAQLEEAEADERGARKRAIIGLVIIFVLIVILIVPLVKLDTETSGIE